MIDGDVPAYNWRPPEERPAEGATVAILIRHWKGKVPESFEILFGTVVSSTDGDHWCVQNRDWLGQGNLTFVPDGPDDPTPFDTFVAWIYASEFESYVLPSRDFAWFADRYPDYKS